MPKNWKLIKRYGVKKAKVRLDKRTDRFLNKAGDIYIEESKKLISNWNHQPKFTKILKTTAKMRSVRVEVDKSDDAGMIWFWQNFGTGIHKPGGKGAYDIEPKTAKVLMFNVGYSAKKAGGDGSSTGKEVFAKKIKDHPGVPAQRLDQQATKTSRSIIRKLYDKFMRRKP